MGARRIGNIKQLCEIVKPDISLILNIGTAHIEIFGSKENILKAKSEIISTLDNNKIAILNKDDESFEKLNTLTNAKVVTFGTKNADISASNIELDKEGFASYILNYKNEKEQVKLKLVGLHQVSNSLAAAAALVALGISLNKIANKLSISSPKSKLRMQVEKSINDIEVINDTYNANPESVIAALETLKLKSQNRNCWAILGEMRELGTDSKYYHELVAQKIIDLEINNTLVIGAGAKYIYDYLMLNSYKGSATYSENVFDAIKICKVLLQNKDLVLVKASRSIGLERVAQVIVSGFDENLISKIQEVGQ
jgi:UDP-N-acetylmuramoyl-tripeptide--D-alanyl-D-alanine ligase